MESQDIISAFIFFASLKAASLFPAAVGPTIKITDFLPFSDLALLKVSIIGLFVIGLLIYFKNNFESDSLVSNYNIIGVISYITLGLILIQSIISQIISDYFIDGSLLVIFLLLTQLIGVILIKKAHQIQTGNQLVLVGSFYTIVTVILFLLTNSLIAGLLAVLGTLLIILGFVENFRKEIQMIGAFYLLITISKILFDILNNFNALVFEIAISSSILAVCLLLLGMIANYKMTRSQTQ